MYIEKVNIANIRAISNMEMTFPNPAGWHVVIGDNGSGKTSLLRAIGFALVGNETAALRVPMESWLRQDKGSGGVQLKIYRDEVLDGENDAGFDFSELQLSASFMETTNFTFSTPTTEEYIPQTVLAVTTVRSKEGHYKRWGQNGWFSAGFGPYRRFSGGNQEYEKIFKSYPRLGAHLSLFGEDVALTEALEWVKELDYRRLKEKEKKGNGKESTITYDNLLKFINKSHLLPHGIQIGEIDKDGIQFRDGNGHKIPTLELSDGYRSILSLTFELIRQLVRVYGAKAVFAEIAKGNMCIPLPGVVLVDEIDAHLHPSWQAEVGFWFTRYFPQLQFIVTTHSPLICRACEKGSIWRLAKPGSKGESGEITGLEKDRLVFGNILDAYGTEVFGENTVRSARSSEKLERLGKLNIRASFGKITPAEEQERQVLQTLLSTDAPTGF